jgi:hypothetical protein
VQASQFTLTLAPPEQSISRELWGEQRMKYFMRVAAAGLGIALITSPAWAAEDYRWISGAEQHRPAFAGATLRMELGGRQALAPEARLGIGFLQERRGSTGGYAGRTVSHLPIALGVADGRLQLSTGDERLTKSRERLGLAGDSTVLIVAGGVAAALVAVLLLTNRDDKTATGPCPPGVEVCAF